jgi:4-diphosphocytidyl-2-C-methyl-D-erythritol kinase
VRLITSAPAKVNLVLRVGPPRPDGYHDLTSLLVPLDLGDGLEVQVASRRGPVTCRVPGHPELDGDHNLAARAAQAFRRRFGVDRAIAIRIEKRIPIIAGLGGGSSDAAAALRCLAHAFQVDDAAAVAEVGLSVGSDVPFFLGEGPAWVTGRGERLRPATVSPLHLVLLYPRDPALAIRAANAYSWLDLDRGDRTVPPLPRPTRWRPTLLGNDLQPPCVKRHPTLDRWMERLSGAGATATLMSGSGPTVFGLFADRASARGAARSLSAAAGVDAEVHLARTVTRQPGVRSWRSPTSVSSRSTRRS